MAVSTASAFRAGRKQSVSTPNAPYLDNNYHSHSPSPVPSGPTAQQWASGNGGGGPSYMTPSLKSSNDGGIGSSLIGTGPGGVTLSSGAPIAANTIGNKPAVAGSSLYQACLSLRDKLWCVPNFGETWLANLNESISPNDATTSSTGISSTPHSPKTSYHPNKPKINASDPVTQLWQCFRLGAPLCWLFNAMGPAEDLFINPDANRSNANECKKQVAKYIMAVRQELGWSTEEMFTVSQLYLNDTNGFVQVIRTITKFVNEFEKRGLLTEPPTSAGTDELEKPSDDRAWIVRELLDTERKYVQDLEVMQNYARALALNDILPTDTIHDLFGNLNTLVDVQRRFLICVEENVRRPADDQHFGHVFQTMEGDFTVYEPFCANYSNSLDIITAEAHNLVRLKSIPSAENCYLEPSYELPNFLIKPVQRICKYPLILDQLIKKTDPDAPFYQELVDGLQVIRRITEKVNETSRLQENIQLVRDLETRVEDWKGHSIQTFGSLLLSDVFMVSKSDTEREYHVYLFEKILLCCKEVLPNQPKKNSKSNSILKQKNQQGNPTPAGKKPKNMLQLKGRIFINNVTAAHGGDRPPRLGGANHALQVWWRGDIEQESFSLKCKNEEQLKQWQAAINKLIEDFTLRRQHMAAHYSQTGGISPGMFNMAGAGANGRRNTGGSLVQQSMFPQTPLTDVVPVNPFTRADSQSSHRYIDEEHMEGMRDGVESGLSSGRGTPMGGRYSQPAEHRERQMSLSAESSRPRARTEDQDSHIMSQWRSNSPANYPPPLPRNGSVSSSSEIHHPMSGGPSQQHQQQQQQLRKASSGKQLRQGFTAAHPRPTLRAIGSADSATSEADVQSTEQLEQMNISNVGIRTRVDSTSSRSLALDPLHHHFRNRSSSNPSAFNVANVLPPPLPKMMNHQASYSSEQLNSAKTMMERKGSGSNNEKRFSSSSISTDDSNRSSHSRPDSTAASSPITLSTSSAATAAAATGFKGTTQQGASIRSNSTYPSSSSSSMVGSTVVTPPNHQSNAIKLVIHHGEDRLVVVVLSTINLQDLTEKVGKKIRLISGRKGPIDNLRIRYIDEDGDKILMHDDEDVQMAFDLSRNLGSDVNLVVL